MTVKELKAAIADLPDDMDVLLHQHNDESHFSMSEKAEVRTIKFEDAEMDPEEWADLECLCITDEL